MELKKYKLGDIAKIEISGVDKKSVDGETLVRLCNFVDVYRNWAITQKLSENFMIASAKETEIAKCSIHKGQVAITKDSETRDDIGIPAYIADDFDNVLLGYHCALITPNEDVLDGKYLNAFMHTRYIQKYFENNASGSGQRYTLSNETIFQIPILLPSLEVQKAIGNLLSNIDRKIELNRQINDNLEKMAKQLYDYWFVQFDFPDENGRSYKSRGGTMVWNEKLKRKIPNGWYCGTLLDIAEYTNGLACQRFRPIDDNKLPVIKIKEMHDGLSSETEWVKSDIPESVKVYDGDVLFSWSASLEVMLWAYGNGGLNQHIFKVTSKNGFPRSFYFYQLIDYIGNFKRMAEARKTTMGHITQDHLKQSTIALPQNVDIANELEKRLCPIFDSIVRNSQEIMVLTKQRDELLPLLMNGQASLNYHLSYSFAAFSILYRHKSKNIEMKRAVIHTVVDEMVSVLSKEQLDLLESVLMQTLDGYEVTPSVSEEEQQAKANAELLQAYLSAKKIEGCSEKTISYYQSTIDTLFAAVRKPVCDVTTNDIRNYLSDYQEQRKVSRVTIDNMRRIFSSFFAWLEDEDFIVKSPVRRIHRVRTESLVKEVLTDENMEVLRDSCQEIRDIAMIDLLASTGMRVGELVNLNREDIDFYERQCVVFGKGNKEREVYFNARTKIHLQNYLNSRTDDNPALFVSLSNPHSRLSISGVEVRLRMLGRKANIAKVHPHKFRRTLATMAIDKGMPIEQVQRLLGHVKIDTTLHYAMVNQNNVKMAHRKYIG